MPADQRHLSPQTEPGTPPDESTPFTWSESHNLIPKDPAGAIVSQPSTWPVVKLKVELQLPLLFMDDRKHWYWHKKWTLPKLHVHVTCNGKPVGGPYAKEGPSPGGEPPVYAVVSAGTLRDGSEGIGLYDQGLGGGDCRRRLMLGQTTFSSLLFQHTSFNCDNRPFHLVVTVLAPSHHPLAIAALRSGNAAPPAGQSQAGEGGTSPDQVVALACMCSSPIVVDARKRTKVERPDADPSDVRLVQRQRGSMPHQPKQQPPPRPPGGPLGCTQAQQMWLQEQRQFANQQLAFFPHLFPSWSQLQSGHQLAPTMSPPVMAPAMVPAMVPMVVAPTRVQPPISASVADVVEACGDALIEMQDTLIVSRLLGKSVFGYESPELKGRSILEILHQNDHEPFVQTARALLAMTAGTPGIVTTPQSVRALHRVFFHLEGQTREVMVDSIITAKRPDRIGADAGLIMSSRCALPFSDSDGGGGFRIFPVGGPQLG